jgi:ceramide glucosyltransferase
MHLPHWILNLHLMGAVFRAALLGICVLGNVYYGFAIFAARDFLSKREALDPDFHPGISILKPIRGLDPEAYRNLASFFRQDYPDYEVIFGAESEADPAVAVVREILHDFPDVRARLAFFSRPAAGSPKVANLANSAAHASHDLLLISDADIRVGPDHLRSIVAPLKDPSVGVVTCLYRSEGRGLPGRMVALSLSTEFQRNALVARKVEGISFAMGSGILLRREVLDRIGGFPAVADYLADDFLLGNLPTRNGYRVEFARDVVDHRLGTRTLMDLLDHQLRWNRGIRVSRPGGYAGLVFTHGAALGLLFLLIEKGSLLGWSIFGISLAMRLLSAWFISGRLLEDRATRRFFWLIPLADVMSFFLWIGGMFGSTIFWRGQRFHLGKNGQLTPQAAAGSLPLAGEKR